MQVVKYEQARSLLATCSRVDEAKSIRDKAEALRVYARQREDLELERWTTEIKLRANRRIGEISAGLDKGHGTGKNGAVKLPPSGNLKSTVLAAAGIKLQTAKRCEELSEVPEEEFERAIAEAKDKGKPVHTTDVIKSIQRKKRERKREARRKTNAKKIEVIEPADLLAGDAKFSTIVLDPPWDWGDEGDCDQLGRARPTYATMPFEELAELPVGKCADDDCHLYLWITNRSLPKGFALLEAWGFRYVTCLTWCKPSFGMGNYFRGQTEQVLFGVKGSQPLKRNDVGTWFQADRGPGGHSSKPDAFYELVEACSPGPYLEMFSRRERADWKSWGEDSHA